MPNCNTNDFCDREDQGEKLQGEDCSRTRCVTTQAAHSFPLLLRMSSMMNSRNSSAEWEFDSDDRTRTLENTFPALPKTTAITLLIFKFNANKWFKNVSVPLLWMLFFYHSFVLCVLCYIWSLRGWIFDHFPTLEPTSLALPKQRSITAHSSILPTCSRVECKSVQQPHQKLATNNGKNLWRHRQLSQVIPEGRERLLLVHGANRLKHNVRVCGAHPWQSWYLVFANGDLCGTAANPSYRGNAQFALQ